jgi:hypothetical protein
MVERANFIPLKGFKEVRYTSIECMQTVRNAECPRTAVRTLGHAVDRAIQKKDAFLKRRLWVEAV